jgi:hypothetical protein
MLKKIHNSVIGFLFKIKFCKPPILIGGCGRSGTTLLLSILSAHPRIYCFPQETRVFCPTAYEERPNLKAPIEINKLFSHISFKQALYLFFKRYHRYCEKTPRNILFFDQLLKIHDSKIKLIHIVRDGRDVITSRHPLNPSIFWVDKERWIYEVSEGLQFQNHPNVFTLRYEDLVLKYQEVIKQVMAFIGEDFDPQLIHWYKHATVREGPWIDGFKNLHDKSMQKWKKSEYAERVNDLTDDPRAVALLRSLHYIA